MFYILEQVVSAMPKYCQKIAELNENDSMKMIAHSYPA